MEQLKKLNKKELCLWSSKVKSKELKVLLKEAGVKGYSKLKKAELLEMVLDMVLGEANKEVEVVVNDVEPIKTHKDDDDFNKLLERKYSKADMENVDAGEELMIIQEDCDDFIKILNDRLFEAEKIANNMTQEDEYKFKSLMGNFLNKLDYIKDKVSKDGAEIDSNGHIGIRNGR